ncbi:putative phage gp36 major capsid-like protein [Bradyrhizobium japonicum]
MKYVVPCHNIHAVFGLCSHQELTMEKVNQVLGYTGPRELQVSVMRSLSAPSPSSHQIERNRKTRGRVVVTVSDPLNVGAHQS